MNEDGTSVVVEIDKTKFFHRKYHRGQWRPGHWVFGGIERGSGKCFLVEVPDRRAVTLKEAIVQYILPGTHIISDGWAAYAQIENINHGIYRHDVIVHHEHFVNPNDDAIHTQNVETFGCALSVNCVDSLGHPRRCSRRTFMNLYGVNDIRIVQRFLLLFVV